MPTNMRTRTRLRKQENVYTRKGIRRINTKDWKELLKKFLLTHRKKIILIFICLIVFLALVPPATYLYFAQDLKDKESIMNRGKTGLSLQDRNGNEFYEFYQPKKITYISLTDIPKSAQESVIATEDKNFYTNPGFSVRGILRAFLVNITAGKIVEGGSTITQELAKNAFLSQSRNVLRKYQELVLASELNRRFSKNDILEMYLNSVYFGEGAFGIENAALAYFGKPAKELTLSQSAMLIGILPAPSAYSPLSNSPENALRRRSIVLDEMVQEKYISQDEANLAKQEPLNLNPNKTHTDNLVAFHFAQYIKKQLIKQYGEERVIREGFTVKTTIDLDFQSYAEQIVKNQVDRLKYNKASNGAAVAIDPHNGHILAMVGSYDWLDEKFGQTNMALTPRQPGSSFKPIIYADAIDKKTITAATILHDVDTTFYGSYKPKDYDLRYRGDVTVRRALANSLNIPAVEVMDKVGVGEGISEAQKFGIDTLDPNKNYGLSLVLGTGEVPLLEMTGAYAVFANNGTYIQPSGILTITNKYGKTIAGPISWFSYLNPFNWFKNPNEPETHNVISKESAFIISSILSDNNARAEEFGGALTIDRPAGVKTGTTEDFRDALTIGYTPSLVVGVWVGNNDNTPMDNIAGSLGAAPIWRSLMEKYLLGTQREQFEKPTFVISQLVCAPGKVTGHDEFFIAGTEPTACAYPTTAPTFTVMPTATPNPTSAQNTPSSTPAPTAIQINQPTPTILPSPTTGALLPTIIPTSPL